MRNLISLVGMLLLLPLLILAVKAAGRRLELSGELKRKLVHVGMGLSCLSFPWLFSSWMWVAGLCAGSLLLLGWVRQQEKRTGEPSALHDVSRKSLGEICFPVAVVLVFVLADGEVWRYVIPILVLTLADAAGALVGVNYGKQKFRVFSGWKTTEGSFLVFFVAFLSVHIPLLLLTEIGRAETLLIAVALAILAMLIEAISVRGLDNLVVPVLVALLLPAYARLGEPALLLRAGVATGLLITVLAGRKESSLEGGALLASVLLGYAVFFFGGWRFLIPPLILFGEHIWACHRLQRESKVRLESNDLWVIIGLALGFSPSMALAAWHPLEETLALRGLVTAAAIHLACVDYSTKAFATHQPGSEWTRQRSIAKAAWLVLVPGFLLSGPDRGSMLLGSAAFLLVQLGLLVFRHALGDPVDVPNSRKRWLVQGGVVFACSLPLWIFEHLLRP